MREADDGLDNGRYRSLLQQLEPQVLGIVGGIAAGDPGGVDIIEQTGIPVINSPTAPALTPLPTMFDINPPFEDLNAATGKYTYLLQQGARRAALVYIAVDQTRAEAQIQRSLMEAAGMEIVQVQELPLSTLSYDSAARSLANSGADYMWMIADAGGNAKMAQALDDIDYQPLFEEYFTGSYGDVFLDLAGPAAEGAVSFLRAIPPEEASSNPAIASFVQWMDAINPDDKKDLYAFDSWASSVAFFQSLEALSGPITREGLVAQLASTGTFDAGGMYGPIRLGAELTNGCVVGMRVVNGAWQRFAPDSGFLC